MSVVLDLHIQDFVNSYKLLGQTGQSWISLVSRRRTSGKKSVASYESGSVSRLATLSYADLPDTDWLLIELWIPAVESGISEYRFDCLRMLSQQTHSGLEYRTEEGAGATLVFLTTRHPGLINVCFILRSGSAPTQNPWLLAAVSPLSQNP